MTNFQLIDSERANAVLIVSGKNFVERTSPLPDATSSRSDNEHDFVNMNIFYFVLKFISDILDLKVGFSLRQFNARFEM